ncbi:MAG: S1/P1 nuclease [Bacteroidetes bacterium]|nr:S1/P1 nuclease [Bacteroidota bacterium]
MKNKPFKRIIVFFVFLYLPYSSMAWGLLGHRIVGQIADSYLTKKAKKAIAAILGDESVAMSSNWPDFIKSDPSYSYLSSWHYIDFKPNMSADSIKAYLINDSATDAYTKMNFLITQLKNKDLEQEKKVMYLRLLIHIVGDVHQPLHVGHSDDQGGNKIKVMWFGTSYNLHSIWDAQLINFQQLSYTEYAAAINHTTKEYRKQLQDAPIADWLVESNKIAEKIYGDIKEPDQKLDYGYNFKYLDTLNSQLLKGGVRLAGILNEIFG